MGLRSCVQHGNMIEMPGERFGLQSQQALLFMQIPSNAWFQHLPQFWPPKHLLCLWVGWLTLGASRNETLDETRWVSQAWPYQCLGGACVITRITSILGSIRWKNIWSIIYKISFIHSSLWVLRSKIWLALK